MKFSYQKFKRTVYLIISFFIVCTSYSIATPDSTEILQGRMFIGYINHDSIKDTIVGRTDSSLQFLPSEIIWGRPTSPALPGDTTYYTPLLYATIFAYPPWQDFTCSIAIGHLNSDTLSDMAFYFWGQVPTTGGTIDTARAIAIFGQRGLDSIATIFIGDIDTVQTYPYVAHELRIGMELTEPEYRDLSGIESYLLPTMDVVIGGGGPQQFVLSRVKDQPEIEVYPNPAVYSASIRATKVLPGKYKVNITTVHGKMLLEQDITVDESGEILKTLHFDSFVTGYYIIQVYSHKTHIGSYPITVIH